MSPPSLPSRIFEFGDFVLDERRMELRRAGTLVLLRATPMRLLQLLLGEHPRVVPKDEILERVWPNAIVADASLATALKDIRRALDDDGNRQQWIRTERGVGYRFVGAVAERPHPPTRSAPVFTESVEVAASDGGFVGRASQLGVLRRRWDALLTSGAQLLVLSGPAGIGKTRLALEFEANVRSSGGHALFGWCYEGRGAPPYWVWSHLLRGLLGSVTEAQQNDRRGDADVLTAILPDEGASSEVAGRLDGAARRWSPEDEFRLFYAVAEVFRRAATHRRILVTVDDIQWAARSSARLLAFLVRELHDAPVLFVVTARDDEPDSDSLEELARALRHPRGTKLTLPRLTEAEGDSILRQELGERFDTEAAALLNQRSQGSPLFLTEVARLLESVPFPPSRDVLHGLIPGAIQEIFLGRVRRLSDACQELLHFVALAGRAVPAALLAQAGFSPTGGVLGEALRSGVLVAPQSGAPSFQFQHSLIAEVLRQSLLPERALELRLRLVTSLEALNARDPRAIAGELASHYSVIARAGGPTEPAVEYGELAGDAALQALSHDEAASYYRLALECLELAPPLDHARVCELLLRIGDALKRAGRLTEFRQAFESALALAREHELPAYFGEAVLGLAPGFFHGAASEDLAGRLESASYDPILVERILEALDRTSEESLRLRSLLLSRCAIAKIGGAPESERAALGVQALELAHAARDRAALSYALSARHSTLCRPCDFEERRKLVEDICSHPLISKELDGSVVERTYSLAVKLELGDLLGADREIRSCIEYAEASRLPRSLRYAKSYAAMRLCIDGRFDAASEQLRALIAEAEEEGDASHVFLLRFRLAHAEHELRHTPEAVALVRAARTRYPELPAFRGGLVWRYVLDGEIEAARSELHDMLAPGLDWIPRNESWPATVAVLAESAARLDEVDLCEEFYRQLEPASGRFIVTITAGAIWRSADALLGGLAATCGRMDEARRHFAQALDLERSTGALPCLARTQHDLVRVLAGRGTASELPRARALLRDSAATARRLSMQPLLHEIQATLQAHPALDPEGVLMESD